MLSRFLIPLLAHWFWLKTRMRHWVSGGKSSVSGLDSCGQSGHMPLASVPLLAKVHSRTVTKSPMLASFLCSW